VRKTKPAARGRGAVSNADGRFERYQHVPFDDGWQGLDWEPTPIVTTVTPEKTRAIITRNDSPDVPFDLSINPYKGCEHGCIYCFARPTLSPGLDFESRIFSKPDAAGRLREEFAKPSYRPQVIAIGANTDPYQPAERSLEITRQILEVMIEHRHPVAIVTKSNLVARDLDLLRELAAERLVHVLISITTLDRDLARRMEPRAPTPERRLQAMAVLADQGVPVGVLASPMIPGLNDAELEKILEAAAKSGAASAGYILLRLPLEVKELFQEWLATHFPTKAAHVLSLIRETREGKLYDPRFGTRMRGTGQYAELLAKRFEVALRRFGLERRPVPLDVSGFRVPAARGGQLALFE
jgi:DNA repair photolyase